MRFGLSYFSGYKENAKFEYVNSGDIIIRASMESFNLRSSWTGHYFTVDFNPRTPRARRYFTHVSNE